MQDDAVTRLLDKPQSQWQKAELEEAFLLLLLRYKEAMDGWGSALESCDALLTTNKALLLFAKQMPDAPAKRGRGRPAKHKDLSWLMDWHADAVKQFGILPDGKLIREYFSQKYKEMGLRKSRINAQEFSVKMESMRKLLVNARRQKLLSQK